MQNPDRSSLMGWAKRAVILVLVVLFAVDTIDRERHGRPLVGMSWVLLLILMELSTTIWRKCRIRYSRKEPATLEPPVASGSAVQQRSTATDATGANPPQPQTTN